MYIRVQWGYISVILGLLISFTCLEAKFHSTSAAPGLSRATVLLQTTHENRAQGANQVPGLRSHTKSFFLQPGLEFKHGVLSPPCAAIPAEPRENSPDNIKNGSSQFFKSVRCDVPPGGLPRITPLPVTEPQPNPQPTPGEPVPNPSPGPVTDPQPGTDPQPQPSEPPFVDPGFRYYPPGKLTSQDAGRGREDRKVWLPDMIFPLKLGENEHPHMNSQIWGYGGGGWGGKGAAGGRECDPRNYDPMFQRDNYCEVRGWSMPLCPAGKGHQGQDIRPPRCNDNKWEVVAVVDGRIDMVTKNTTVRLVGKDGTKYRYLHMHPRSIRVRKGQRVKQGDVLGRISRYMNGRRSTSTHLHFDVKQNVKIGNGRVRSVYVPLYSSLIAAYRKAKGLDRGIDADGNLIAQYPLEIGVPKPPPPPEPAPSEPTEPTEPTPPSPTPGGPTEPTPPSPTPGGPTEPTPPSPTPGGPTEPTPPSPTPDEPAQPPPGDRTWWQWSKDTVDSWWTWWNG